MVFFFFFFFFFLLTFDHPFKVETAAGAAFAVAADLGCALPAAAVSLKVKPELG